MDLLWYAGAAFLAAWAVGIQMYAILLPDKSDRVTRFALQFLALGLFFTAFILAGVPNAG